MITIKQMKTDFTPTELAYLLDVIEQEIDDYKESVDLYSEQFNKLHLDILNELHKKLLILNK